MLLSNARPGSASEKPQSEIRNWVSIYTKALAEAMQLSIASWMERMGWSRSQ
ncbi:hypothetical protein D3C71_2197460 [compost metagenome]